MSISVIIPVKNRADLLKSTLDNILSQSLLPIEIIVIDDHSTDDLYKVKETYQDRVIFAPSMGNGPGAARNTGFKISSGKYIQFFDSDDLMTYDKLQIQSNQLQHSTSGMAYCPHVKALQREDLSWLQTDSILYYKPLSSQFKYDQWVLRGACMITQACLFKRELIQDAGLWRTDLITHEDLEFLFRIGRQDPFPIHSSIPAVIYRQHEFQITDKNTSQYSRAKDQLEAYCLIHEQMTEYDQYTFMDHKVIASNIIRSAAFVEQVYWPKGTAEIVSSPVNKGAHIIDRISKKIQRKITGSDWNFVHGIHTDPVQFEKYIHKLYKK